jgi:hypothetical protein
VTLHCGVTLVGFPPNQQEKIMNDYTIRVDKTPVEKMEGWELADALGTIQTQIGDLKSREAELKGALIELRKSEFFDYVEGEVYRATLSEVDRNQVNWKLIATKLGASRQIITAHSRTQSFTTVRLFELED